MKMTRISLQAILVTVDIGKTALEDNKGNLTVAVLLVQSSVLRVS